MALNNFEISKTLKASDIMEKRVELPVNIVEHMKPAMMKGEHFVELMALDRWQREWPLKYSTRGKDREKASFSAGWPGLVAANGVLPGDKLIFSRHQDGGEMPYYMIQVRRQITTLEGEIFDVEVIRNVQGQPMNYF